MPDSPENLDALRAALTPEQRRVMWEKGTEPAFTGPLLHERSAGDFLCATCGHLLFRSEAKFDSGSGWPSFFAPAGAGSVHTAPDDTLGMPRTEAVCARCGAHLGHVFPDGPDPTGERYCMNSASLHFDAR